MSLTDLTAVELLAKLQSGETTSAELTRAFLDRIEAVDGQVKAFIRVDPAAAMARAEEIDRRRKAGKPLGRLAGMPVAIKDLLCTARRADHVRLENARPISARPTTPRSSPS